MTLFCPTCGSSISDLPETEGQIISNLFPPKQLALFSMFYNSIGVVLEIPALITKLYSKNNTQQQKFALDRHIHTLRQVMIKHRLPYVINNVWGVGYVMERRG